MRPRLARRLARKHRAPSEPPQMADDPAARLKAAVAALRVTAKADPTIDQLCDRLEAGCDDYIVRRGPFEPRPRPMPAEWGGKLPPEPGEQ